MYIFVHLTLESINIRTRWVMNGITIAHLLMTHQSARAVHSHIKQPGQHSRVYFTIPLWIATHSFLLLLQLGNVIELYSVINFKDFLSPGFKNPRLNLIRWERRQRLWFVVVYRSMSNIQYTWNVHYMYICYATTNKEATNWRVFGRKYTSWRLFAPSLSGVKRYFFDKIIDVTHHPHIHYVGACN